MSLKKISFYNAISIVIANMIGTGVFTSLGFQVFEIKSLFSIMLLWALGGIIAFSGAAVYGELGAAFPRSGGEYNFLSKLYHPALGFLSGWVSATVGFAAPIALAALALGKYVNAVFPELNSTILATVVILIITAVHAFNVSIGGAFQRYATAFKVAFIMVFITIGLVHDSTFEISALPTINSKGEIFSSAFAISLIFVTYAYSGWNAAAYVVGDIENPNKNLPRALIGGTLIVAAIYLLLNFIFMNTVPVNELMGQIEIGNLSATKILGDQGGKTMSMIIALLLVSSISAMIFAGPRVIMAMSEDLPQLNFFAQKNSKGTPYVAVITQATIALILVINAQFETVLKFTGFTLNIFAVLTVAGIFILRSKHKDIVTTYKTWGYPLTPIIFIGINVWTFYFVIKEGIGKLTAENPKDRSYELVYEIALLVVGLLIYFLFNRNKKTSQTQ